MLFRSTVKAIRDTIARYPHDPVELTIIRALFDQLNEQVTEFSSIWWRVREIEKLDTESEADSADTAEDHAETIKDSEEVTENGQN